MIMGARRTNKKRNALLVFEFLTKEASKRLVAGDNEGSNKVLAVVKQSYALGTELHKEYRLANALLVTSVSSASVASRILTEARNASKNIDHAKLESEKTQLIARIERDVDPSGAIYEAQLPDYRLRSTVGNLLADWRNGTYDIGRQAQYEDQLIEHLTVKHDTSEESLDDETDKMSVGERRALISVMSRKLEERWGDTLTKDQKSLLRDYVLAKDPAQLLNKLNRIREDAMKSLDSCSSIPGSSSPYFTNRLSESKQAIANKQFETVDDASISLGLLYLKLIAESADKEEAR
jgi:hypothetical protein